MQSLPLRSPSGISIIPVAVEHATAFATLIRQNTEHLQTYLPAVAHLSSIEAAGDHLRFAVERASKAEVFEWNLFVDGTLCGSVRLKHIDTSDRKAEIGYFIGQQFTGKGIVSSAVLTVLEFCFGPLDFNRIELRCASGNEPSKRVAERLGFVHEGVLRQGEFLNGVFVDQHIYGLLVADFEAHRRRPSAMPSPTFQSGIDKAKAEALICAGRMHPASNTETAPAHSSFR